MTPQPRVAVVVATYRRPDVLESALSSLVAQTFGDWHALVVGDHTADRTAEVVSSFGDPRLAFVDLAVNFGEQSGPNNVGIARTTSPLVAFLNHDDLWFPDHLAISVDTLDARQADLVFGPNLTVHAGHEGGLPRVSVDGLSADGRYDAAQVDRATPASSWLVRRDLLVALGGWPAAQECVVEPSQELLFRAHRRGARLWSTGVSTVVTLASGTRAGSYLGPSDEHRWFADRMSDPGFRALLLACDVDGDPPARRSAAWWRRASRLGVSARRIAYRRRGLARGGRLGELRGVRGLDPSLGSLGRTAAEVRRAEVLRSCEIEVDQPVEFHSAGTGHRFTASGWSRPEDWGVWSIGSSSEIALAPPGGPHRVELTLRAHVDEHHPRQRVHVSTQGRERSYTLVGDGPASISVDIDSGATPVVVSLTLPDAFTPANGDTRVLGVGLVGAVVHRRDAPMSTVTT